MSKALLLGILLTGIPLLIRAQEHPAPSPLASATEAIASAYLEGAPLATGYRQALLLEGILRYRLARGDTAGVDKAVAKAAALGYTAASTGVRYRGPFNCLPYWLYVATGDPAWIPGLLKENRAYAASVARSPEGAILHPRSQKRGGGHALLIDALQDYSFRMAVTGRLTRDPSCYRKAVEQFTLYHDLVRYPETGLYSQGRGWLDDPEALSPGAWSRGHGWLIRGMVDTLIVLPPKSDAAATLKGHLAELAAALLAVQQPSGLWPCLLDRAPDLSPPEVSGTALIAGNLAIAVAGGWLPADPYARSARRAFSALPAFVEPGGTVRSVSPGPGPLSETGPWSVKAFPPGDEHGPFAILFAALGEWELSQSGFSADP